MKNSIKSILKFIIYGLIIFAGSTYAAKTYYASDIVYASENGIDKTVDEALDDLYYASSNFANPTGAIVSMMSNEAPTGYLKCDGTVYNISDYQKLANHIKKQFGSYNYFGGDGETTFAVPDLQGEFLRGTGTNSHENSGNGASVGIHQSATNNIYFGINNNDDMWIQTSEIKSGDSSYPHYYDSLINSTNKTGKYWHMTNTFSGNGQYLYTSRPTNTSVLYCIKY